MRVLILERGQLMSNYECRTGPIRIGSSSDNHVHISDLKISPHQATIESDSAGAWWLTVKDLSRPTIVNRSIVKERVQLHQRDEIELGPFTLRVFVEHEVDVTQRAAARDEALHQRMVNVTRSHNESLPLGTILAKHDKPVTLARDLLEQFSLLGMRIERLGTAQEVMTPMLRALLRAFGGRRAWIGLRKATRGDCTIQSSLDNKGAMNERPATCVLMQSRCLDEGQYLCVPKIPIEGMGAAMGAPLVYESTHIGMIYVENDAIDPPYTEETLDQFSALACCVAMPIGDVMRRAMIARQTVLNHEVAVAREVQDAVTPHALPHWDHLQIAAYRHPGANLACDFYDVVQLKDKAASMLVARVTAQGAQLPRLLAEVRAAFRMSAVHSDGPAVLMRALNWLLFSGDNTRYIDAVAVQLDAQGAAGAYCIAGQRVLLGRMHSDGGCERLEAPSAPAVGQVRQVPYEALAFQLEEGDTVVIATDGANAAVNPAGETLGIEAMHDSLCDGVGNAPGQVLHEFDEDLKEFLSDRGKAGEDITVLLARRS